MALSLAAANLIDFGFYRYQAGHGISTWAAVYFNGTAWVKAKADAPTTLGLVIAVAVTADILKLYFFGYVTGLSGLTAGEFHFVSGSTAGALVTTDPNASNDSQFSNPILFADSTTSGWVLSWRPSQGNATTAAASTLAGAFGHRLTLTSGTSATSADVTGAGTLYLTPHRHNKIDLYYGGAWRTYAVNERPLTLTVTSGKNYDAFAYYTGSDGALELSAAWTDDNTRATALALDDGYIIKSGDPTRRWAGTIRASGTNTVEDSTSKRFIWNAYNQVVRVLRGPLETTDSWSYTTASLRQARNTATNQFEYVSGEIIALQARALSVATTSSGSVNVFTGIGLDSSTVSSAQLMQDGWASSVPTNPTAFYDGYPSLGYHAVRWLEYGGSNVTFYGDAGVATVIQSGIQGRILG